MFRKARAMGNAGMPRPLHSARGCRFPALALCLVAGRAIAAEPEPLGYYELTIEMQMPHLDENLRYATRRQARCVDRRWLAAAFASLAYNALSDCALAHERRDGDAVSYELVCSGGHG